MLKTLKPELRENPRFSMLIEKEFDVRYNLCHPNIVMINDFEEVPGLGMCIITDDVYGDSLRKLIDKGEVNQNILEKILLQLPEAIAYIQKNHIVHDPIKPETIIFTENIRNLKLINVGFDQREHLTPTDASEDIYNYGLVLQQVLDAMDSHNQRYRRVAERCLNSDPRHRYRDIQDLKMALAGDSNMRLYITIIVFLSLMTIILGWLCWAAPSL
jgi:serine/threonine protein kinase